MPSHTALAQTATLAPITVTAPADAGSALATGSRRAAIDAPFSVSGTPSDTVRAQGGTTLQDALRNVPGAQADSGFNGSHTQFFILRGAAVDNGTGSNRVLRDGVRLSNYPYVPAFVERVDVLRGPGAALGVRSEPGGTVNLVSRLPQVGQDFGSLYTAVGSRGQHEVSADVNRVVSAEHGLAARAIATRSAASTWRHVSDRLDGLKLGLAQQDAERFKWRVGYEATNQTYQPDYGIPAANGRPVAVPRDRQFGEPFGDSTTDNRILDFSGELAVGNASRLHLDVARLRADSTSIKNLLNGSPLAGQPPGTYARVSAWEPGTERAIDSQSLRFTHQARTGVLRHQFAVGAERYRETLQQPALTVPAPTSPPINVYNPVFGRVTAPPAGLALQRSLTTQDLDAEALSLQDQVDWEDWSAVAGLRYDRQNFRYGAVGVQAVEERRWSPKLGVLRRLGDAQTVYANYATGLSPNQVASSSNQSLASRRSAQVEVGWKALWQGGRVQTDVALYRLHQSNMIASDVSTPAPFDFTLNGSARSQGVEASVRGPLADALDVQLSYAYTDAQFRENPVYGGQRVPNVARHAAYLHLQYAWDARWKTGLGLALQGPRFADEANTTVLPGYARVDLVQAWRFALAQGQSLELQLAVRNLFDKAYFVSSHLHVSRWITPGAGRSAVLSAAWSF